jgi:hypothetical protein
LQPTLKVPVNGGKGRERLTTYWAERQVSDELPAIQTDLFWMPQRPLMAATGQYEPQTAVPSVPTFVFPKPRA